MPGHNSTAILTLRLKREWWEQIRAGVKRSELRRDGPRNRLLLAGRRYAEVHLWLGYPPRTALDRRLRFRVTSIARITLGAHPEFGAGPTPVWEIALGERLD